MDIADEDVETSRIVLGMFEAVLDEVATNEKSELERRIREKKERIELIRAMLPRKEEPAQVRK